MRRLVLVHGWGFDRHMWDPVLAALASRRVFDTVLTPDLGFFGQSTSDLPARKTPLLAVGHSLGLLWLLLHAPLPPDTLLLGINGFTRFARTDDFPAGVPPRVLDRMKRALGEDPTETVRQFHASCGPGRTDLSSSHAPCVPALAKGLDLLRAGDARPQTAKVAAVLATRDDPIVSPAMTEASFPAAAIHWAETGGHLLPLTCPELCAAFIDQAAKRDEHDG